MSDFHYEQFRTLQMLNVGLTGNVAAGKSTVSALFADWGATLIDADAIVHALQAPGEPINTRIIATFGKDAVSTDGSLDRSWLRRRVLDDPNARQRLNDIVHPAVQQQRTKEMAQARRRGDKIVVNDIPLLFEVMDPGQFDVIVLVDANKATRISRLVERGLDRKQAEALIATQMDAESKRARSDFVIDNNGTKDELQARAKEVWRELHSRASIQEPS